jgi:hypothetical protein
MQPRSFILNFKITPKDRVSTLQLDMPYTRSELLTELENEEWVSPGIINPLNADLWNGTRFKCMHPKPEHSKLTALANFLNSGQTKHQLISWLFDTTPSLSYEYDWTVDTMYKHCSLHSEITRDSPGFINVLHTDYRKLVATAMIYLTDRDDPTLSTYFYDTMERDNPIRMPTNFGHGWLHSNGNNTWHEGWNKTPEVRYTILLGLTMNVTPL